MKNKCIYLLIMLFSTAVYADEQQMRWSFKGFGTLGVAGSDTHELGFQRSTAQTKDITSSWGTSLDSRLGLQVSVDFNASWTAAAQLVVRDQAGDFLNQNLDWAFLRWNINDTNTLRVGRLGTDVFLLSDYRNVGYAYPWMRPPHEFYNSLAVYHFDGFDYTKNFHFGNDVLNLKIFAGYNDNEVESDFSEAFDLGIPIGGLALKFESGNWTTRLGYAHAKFNDEVPNEQLIGALNDPLVKLGLPGIERVIPSLLVKGSTVDYYALGAAYDDGTWIAQAEVSYTDTNTTYFPDSASAYLSIGKRISNVTVYSLLGISHSWQKDIEIPSPVIPLPQLQQLHDVVDNTVNSNGVDQKSISLGARWDVYQNIALKTQWSHFWIGENGSQLWTGAMPAKKSTQVNVWSIGVDFIF